MFATTACESLATRRRYACSHRRRRSPSRPTCSWTMTIRLARVRATPRQTRVEMPNSTHTNIDAVDPSNARMNAGDGTIARLCAGGWSVRSVRTSGWTVAEITSARIFKSCSRSSTCAQNSGTCPALSQDGSTRATTSCVLSGGELIKDATTGWDPDSPRDPRVTRGEGRSMTISASESCDHDHHESNSRSECTGPGGAGEAIEPSKRYGERHQDRNIRG